eukprot:m.41259 g.41259  ORF g.41259 m.41259 type:complete len:235 (+) comp11802_c0_seq3:97-801(+)
MARSVTGAINWEMADEVLAVAEQQLKMKATHAAYELLKDDGVVRMERLERKELKRAGLDDKADVIKLTTIIDVSPREAAHLLNDYEVRKTWENTLTKESRSDVLQLERDDGRQVLQVIRTLSNPAMGGLISPREFIDLAMTTYKEDGSVFHVAQSILHPDFPVTQGFVRGTNFPCGMYYDVLADEASTKLKTKITYIIQSEVGGWLPASLVFKGTTTTMWNIMQCLHTHLREKQ